MAKLEWREDSEVMGIAVQLVEKYPDMLGEIDLGKVRFVRILEKKAKKILAVKSCGFPFNIDNNYVYYIMINNNKWQMLNEKQKNLAVMGGLYTITPGGTDSGSVNYGKKRQKDVEDYSMVLCAAGGRYDWGQIGTDDIPNVLGDEEVKAEAMVADANSM